MRRTRWRRHPPAQLVPKPRDGEVGVVGLHGLVELVAGSFVVPLTKLLDGGGAREGVDGLVVVNQQSGIKVGEIVVDVTRHL